MFTYTKEKELHEFIIENFNSYFDFEYRSSEFIVVGGRVDIIGVKGNAIYVVELKRDFVSDKTIEQLSNYLPQIRLLHPDKEVFGIAVAPSLEKSFSGVSLPPDISIKLIDGIEYIKTEINSTKKRVTFTIDEDVLERLKHTSKEYSVSQAELVESAIKKIVEEYEQKAAQK